MNSTKYAVRPMNSSKNKLNSKIILIFHHNPNTHKKEVKEKKNGETLFF